MPAAKVLGKFLRLPRADRNLVLSAALLLMTIRAFLWLLSLRRARAAVLVLTRAFPSARGDYATEPERVALAVTRAASCLPGATCLVQALAAQALLERRGLPARLRIGVGRTGEAGLRGHAWVESGGVVVIGGGEGSYHTVLDSPLDDQR